VDNAEHGFEEAVSVQKVLEGTKATNLGQLQEQ